MSQCVPGWVLDQNPAASSKMTISSSSLPTSLDYEVAELTWENGQIAMHSLGPPRVVNKLISPPATWDKPRASGTLESIVNQATSNSHPKPPTNGRDCTSNTLNDLVPWYEQDHQHRAVVKPVTSGSLTVTMDALVPCTARTENHEHGTCVGSCNPARVARADMGVRKGNHVSLSVSESTTCGGRDSRQLTLDTCEMELGGAGFTSTSMGSPGNTFSGKEYTVDDHDSVCHSKRKAGDEGGKRKAGDEDGKRKAVIGKSSISTKRSRAAAIHNQSERKRRDKINERMKTLQKMVPNSSKTDKASMLDEVIEYLRQLQTQVQMMNRMNISPMMLSLAMQPQLQQMAMMQMAGMGMGMGVNVMDINAAINRTAAGVQPVVQPQAAFMPVVSWDNAADRLVPPATSVVQDPLSAYLATQSQPMNVDAYSRLAALYQQLQQNPVPVPGSKI